MVNLPRWAVIGLCILLALACALAIYASIRKIKTDKAAREGLLAGKVQLAISPTDMAQLSQSIAAKMKTQN